MPAWDGLISREPGRPAASLAGQGERWERGQAAGAAW